MGCSRAKFHVFFTIGPGITEKPPSRGLPVTEAVEMKALKGVTLAIKCPEVLPVTSDQFHWPQPVI